MTRICEKCKSIEIDNIVLIYNDKCNHEWEEKKDIPLPEITNHQTA